MKISYARRIAAASILIAILWETALAEGAGRFPAYDDSKAPATAITWVTFRDPTQAFGSEFRHGTVLDADGDRVGDLADFAQWDYRSTGYGDLNGPIYVSPSDPRGSAYLLVRRVIGDTESHAVIRIVRSGSTWTTRAIQPLPAAIDLPGLDTPVSRGFFNTWMGLTAFRRTDDGCDAILCVATAVSASGFTLSSKYALFVDGPDADTFADHWTDVHEIPGVELITIDERGNALAREVQYRQPSGPYYLTNSDALVRVADTDCDGVPDTVDGESRVTTFASTWTRGVYGPGDFDMGTDRAVLGVGYPLFVDLDSHRRPITGSDRIGARVLANETGRFTMQQPFAMHDGTTSDFTGEVGVLCGLVNNFGVAIWDDTNFDELTDDLPPPADGEVRKVVTTCDFQNVGNGAVSMGGNTVPELAKVTMAGGGAVVRFRDYGVFPGDEAFKFRYGSQDFESMWVGANGTVSFAGTPVTGQASRTALEHFRGVIAPCWSDQWDTSELQVFAGYTPIQKSFRTGDRVLAFAVEYRGLRAPGWEPGRRISARLLLFSDGTFRTDYGAFEASEVGGLRMVAGYSGPGAAASAESVDVSAHTWGDAPAGTTGERALSEEFGTGNPSDVGHIWIRWNGYPERTDPAGPTPNIVDPVVKMGKKLVLQAAGSNITAGATVLVDGAETFTLKKKGSSWIVMPKDRSTPGAKRVRDIWADEAAHTIVVTNPTGEQSAPVDVQ